MFNDIVQYYYDNLTCVHISLFPLEAAVAVKQVLHSPCVFSTAQSSPTMFPSLFSRSSAVVLANLAVATKLTPTDLFHSSHNVYEIAFLVREHVTG